MAVHAPANAGFMRHRLWLWKPEAMALRKVAIIEKRLVSVLFATLNLDMMWPYALVGMSISYSNPIIYDSQIFHFFCMYFNRVLHVFFGNYNYINSSKTVNTNNINKREIFDAFSFFTDPWDEKSGLNQGAYNYSNCE
jgi:hypothetical protein